MHCFDCTVGRGAFDLRAMKRRRLIHEPLTRSVIGAFYEVYNTLGFGFLEHIYILALERELRSCGHQVRREAGVCVMYKGEELAYQRLDMIVDDVLIVEVKSTSRIAQGRQPSGLQLLTGDQSRGRSAASLRPRAKVLPFISP